MVNVFKNPKKLVLSEWFNQYFDQLYGNNSKLEVPYDKSDVRLIIDNQNFFKLETNRDTQGVTYFRVGGDKVYQLVSTLNNTESILATFEVLK